MDREREKREWEREREEKEREFRLREQELELRKLELQIQANTQNPIVSSSQKFYVTKHVRMVPPFQEREVDQYFLHSEKIATNCGWPKDSWTMLLQSVLVGKAREIYSQLSIELSANYDTVKELILNGYYYYYYYYLKIFYNGSPISRHYSTVFQGAVHARYINLYIFTKQTYILITIY